MNTKRGKVTGLAVVRSKDGYVRANNFENLSDQHKQALLHLIITDGCITAESYPNIDERFKQWL